MGYRTVYDITKIGVNIGVDENTFPVEGIVKLSAKRNEETYGKPYVSQDGSFRHVRKNDRSGEIEITISQDSPTNQLIMALNKTGLQFPIMLVDKTTSANAAVAFGDGCMLSKPPDFVREVEQSDLAYVFNCGDLEIHHAGAADE